ncbi:MAG: PA domain-containing protein [Acidobacteriota bacterium]
MRCRSIVLIALAALLAVTPAFAQVTGSIDLNDERQQGASVNGNPLLFTPDPVRPGSSVSHWDDRAFPNLLMEPAINPDLPFLGLDITDEQMKDIGWTLTADVAGNGSTFNIFPFDDGFFDPRPFDGAPGNDATTLGEARINLFVTVFTRWAQTLESAVDVDVIVLWSPQFCDPNQGAVLAAAGSTFIFFDDTLPVPDTWYHAALTEALVGADVTGPVDMGGGDIVVFMNSNIDEGCLGDGTGYYYGLDGNDPPNQIDIAPVILHEVGHGLGMSNFANETTGETPQDLPSIYDTFSRDIDQAKTWAQMNNAERVQSAVNFGRLEWTGANATAAAQALLATGVPELQIGAPANIAGNYDVGLASFGPAIPDGGLAGDIACLVDGAPETSIFDGCSEAVNGDELAGKIALIDRGNCSFADKARSAQNAGAIAAIIANNAGNTPIGLGGAGDDVTIPTVGIGAGVGAAIRAEACGDIVSNIGGADGSRFQVSAQWSDGTQSQAAGSVRLTDDTGYFWFFDENNVELVVKVLDGCAINENYWVFAAGLTDVEVTITVLDTTNGQAQTYENALGTPFAPIQDIEAFATCP